MDFQSERLIFKKITNDDVEKVHSIFGNANLTRFFASGADKSIDESKIRVEKIILHWNTYAFGDYIVFDKTNGELIGFGGLHFKNQGGKVNLAYVVGESYQGKGFGYEISMRLLDYGFNQLKLLEIVAEIDPGNKKSKKLIEKCGLSHSRIISWKGFERDEYIITNSEYKSLNKYSI